MSKAKVIVLFGGAGAEHEISLLSALSVLTHIDKNTYSVYPVGITKAGIPYYFTGDMTCLQEWEKDTAHLRPVTFGPRFVALGEEEAFCPDAIFPALHGDYGEDGRLQGLLDCLRLPYVGCGCLCSALCMHKHFAKLQFVQRGIPTAKWICVSDSCISNLSPLYERLEKQFRSYSLFVKPATGGSSVGASIIHTKKDILPALKKAFLYSSEVLIEEQIKGKECEVGVFSQGETVVSRPASIETTHEFYDYNAKYKEKSTRLCLPASLPKVIAEQMQGYARLAFDGLGCRHLARFDFFYTEDGRVLLNEVNTMPGMTSCSLYPKMMEDSGIPFPLLVSRLLMGARS